ncbi:MAG TPA: DNA cytosine methyltransferase [bacterium]|nr:DNA cytosine methyltransferase [bacterium]
MKKTRNKTSNLRVIELFAGVGGFHIGLSRASKKFEIVWSNQWEPDSRTQYASNVYKKRFPNTPHSNEDISTVTIRDIPDHDLLVGGFPCQDYSVARTLNQAKGLVGKKGVLWWQIYRILDEKKNKPAYLILENVDRLLKSPANRRGRDFAVMLASLSDLGYAVEWRTINAADYGMPQRRRRVFFVGYHKDSLLHSKLVKDCLPLEILEEKGVIAKAFPVEKIHLPLVNVEHELKGDLANITERFNINNPKISPFHKAGFMVDRRFWTFDVKPLYAGKRKTLGDVLIKGKVPESFYIEKEDFEKWRFLKGAKDLQRVSKRTGHKYQYNEGPMSFPDKLDFPSRTIITGEGGSTPSRFKHVVKDKSGRLRRLLPIELERLNTFPDNHTAGIPDIKRAFMMGNALVVDIVKQLGKALISHLDS